MGWISQGSILAFGRLVAALRAAGGFVGVGVGACVGTVDVEMSMGADGYRLEYGSSDFRVCF